MNQEKVLFAAFYHSHIELFTHQHAISSEWAKMAYPDRLRIKVPTPWSVKISSSTACSTRPSMI